MIDFPRGEKIMSPLIRKLLAIIAGVVVGGIVVFLSETAGHSLYPPPSDINVKDPADLQRLMDVMPVQAKILVVAAWFLGAFAGAWTANRISGLSQTGWIVGLIFALLSIMTVISIPHPVWMTACAIILPFAAAWLATRVSSKASA
jgi:hypothetical protein